MDKISMKRTGRKVQEVRLLLESTDIPSSALPRGDNGEHLFLPTASRVVVRGEDLRIEMILLDPEEWGNNWYVAPDFDDENPPILALNLNKQDIVRLTVGGHPRQKPRAVLVINDPLEVVEALTLTFGSNDSNNPQYPILALVKMLREGLGIPIQEFSHTPQADPDDLPF